MTRREKITWQALGLAFLLMLAAVAALVVMQRPESAEAQSSQSRDVDWYYWLDTGYPRIQRSRLDGSGVAETIVSSSEMSTTHDFAVDGDYVYWGDDGHNQIRRKSADGTGSVENLVTTGISSPYRIAVDYSYVYWADTGNDTIKRAQTYGSYTVSTLADSSDGVSNVTAIDVYGSYLYWADSGNDSVRQVATFGSNTVTTLVSTGLSNPQDVEVGRNGNYVYLLDRNGTSSTIKRVLAYGSHTVDTLAANSGDTPMDDPLALALDPDNDFVYWLDEDDNAVRRVATDGASGSFETLTTSAGGTTTDLAVSPGGGSVYWLDNNGDDAKHLFVDGSGSVTDVVNSGLSVPARIRVAEGSETVDGSCITDAGTLDADYASHDWEADIDATCPSAFYTFRLSDAADLRITATSSSIDPLPILRKGGIDGEIAALTTVSNGASTPYVYMAGSGQHTIELVRGPNSSNTSGSFSARLQTQPMLSGCDVNLGTLSSDEFSVFGAYDADCGDTRKYFVYLEFQASISASASAVGFTPRIELRPGAASDSSTPTATDSGNPADIYQQVTSGSYRVNLELITAGNTYNLTFQAFGLPPPTRTPIPTPTPRFQPNVDVRMEPNPVGVAYEENEVYAFRLEGGEASFPVLVRVDNDADFALTSSGGLDCSAGDRVDDLDQLQAIHLHVCDEGTGATIQVIKESDYSLLATYSIFVPGPPLPKPTAASGPTGGVGTGTDRIGLGEVITVICEAGNWGCDVGLIRNGIGAGVPGILFLAPTAVSRGRTSKYSGGIGVALSILGLILAHLLAGLPFWWAGAGLVTVLFLAGAQLYLKFRRVGS